MQIIVVPASRLAGALLQTTQDVTTPRVNQSVTVSGVLTADGAPVPLTSGNVVVHAPDGSKQLLETTVNGNHLEVQITPAVSGIYGIEVDVTAQTSDGVIIDRAAFLTLDVEPTWLETTRNQILAGVLIFILIVGMITLMRRRRRKRQTGILVDE